MKNEEGGNYTVVQQDCSDRVGEMTNERASQVVVTSLCLEWKQLSKAEINIPSLFPG